MFVIIMVGARPQYGFGYRNNGRRAGGRSYTDIARVLNPSPYAANPRGVFPGQPFWPFTG